MASATKTKDKTATVTPEAKAPRLKKDGTPWAPAVKRSNAELLADYEARLVKRKADHAAEIARIEKKIEWFKNPRKSSAIDPEQANAAAQELLKGGMTAEQIITFAEKARLAVAAVKGKSEDEIKTLLTPPAFLTVTPQA